MPETPPFPGLTGLMLLVARIISAVLFRLLTAPLRWRNWNGAPTLFKDVFYTGIRTMLGNITIAQSRYIFPSTDEVYVNICKQTQQEPRRLNLENSRAVWIGREAENADNVIFYLHGGGYTQPCPLGHMQYLHRLMKDTKAEKSIKGSISVLLLAYTLVPETHYPAQLNQAATVLSYLVSEMKRDPATIIIAGDSAGGNLAISLLSHILHPRPGTPKIILKAPLHGALFYSPWVSFSTKYDSYIRNAGKDTLIKNMLEDWGQMYIGRHKGSNPPGYIAGQDSYNEPLHNASGWWKGMHEVVGQVLIWMGEDEIFIDGLQEFAASFAQGWKNGGGSAAAMEVYEARGEPHIGPILDVLMETQEKSQSQLVIEEWFKKCLQSPNTE